MTGAESPACGMLMLHLSENRGGMSSMRHVDSIDVAPGGALEFKPGGYHLMCMQPGPAIKPGRKHTGHFDVQGRERSVTTNFPVRDATGK